MKRLMHLTSESLPLQWTTVADALLRKRFSIKTGTHLNDHCGSVRKNASIPLRMRLLAFAAPKPCLNSLCNRCARVSKTSTLAVHICTARCHRLYSSDSDDDEEHERVPPVHDGDADDGDHWMGHPFPCSSMGSCGSQLRIIRAAAVHYPLLRKFLNLLYQARWHHRRALNLDNALCSADFRELMKLTDIESYGALYKGSKGESGCACENSTPGLPNLEPQLKVRHAELIMSLEKNVSRACML